MDNPQQAANWAYIAGIVDGEGTIRLQWQRARNPSLYTPMLIVTSVNEGLVSYLAEAFAGWTREYTPPSRNGNARNAFTVTVQGRAKIRPILEAIQPYVIVKRPHVELMLRFLEECPSYAGVGPSGTPPEQLEKREWYFEEFKRLNQRGRAVAETEREDADSDQ